LRKIELVALRSVRRRFLQLIPAVMLAASIAGAQTAPEAPVYTRVNTFGFFATYSNDSSHILMGYAGDRKLLEFGATWGRRLIHNHTVNWQYNVELLPVALESDPLGLEVTHQVTPFKQTYTQSVSPPISCTPSTSDYSIKLPNGTVYSGTQTISCNGREWNIGEAFSPVGFQWNFRPTRPLQPFLIGHGGYMYTTHPIPTQYAGSFNFTFDLGAGVELYRTPTHSIRAEWRFHHISNHYTAADNPGIDNGIFQLTYAFGR
jgi:hypothetical protein